MRVRVASRRCPVNTQAWVLIGRWGRGRKAAPAWTAPPTTRRKKVVKIEPCERQKNRRRGRPTLLTAVLAEDIARRVESGTSLRDAALDCGISPRTLRSWRQRAWSPRPEDRQYVALEQRVIQALARRAAEADVPERWEAAAERITMNEQWWRDLGREVGGPGMTIVRERCLLRHLGERQSTHDEQHSQASRRRAPEARRIRPGGSRDGAIASRRDASPALRS